MAATLATQEDDFGYANLATRGRKLLPILAEQIEPALALKPDLVSIYAGANDVLRPKVNIDDLAAAYSESIGRLGAGGAQIVMFTAYDPGDSAIFGALRGGFAIYNELVREIAEQHGATVVDFWRLRDYRDHRMWAADRMHMSSAGHQRMAIEVLNALGVGHGLEPLPLDPPVKLNPLQLVTQNLDWARSYAAPWIKRRLTGVSSGDSLSPRRPGLAPV